MSLTSFAGDGANATDEALCRCVAWNLERWFSPATHHIQNPGNTSRMLSALARTRRCLKPHTPGSGRWVKLIAFHLVSMNFMTF